jgi:hypothetical protein
MKKSWSRKNPCTWQRKTLKAVATKREKNLWDETHLGNRLTTNEMAGQTKENDDMARRGKGKGKKREGKRGTGGVGLGVDVV